MFIYNNGDKYISSNSCRCNHNYMMGVYWFIFTIKQTYFQEPKYPKNYLVLNPQNLYEQYVNAFAFSEMVKSQNLVQNKRKLQLQAQNSWREVRTKDRNTIQNLISELLKTLVQSPPFTFFSQ